MSLSIDQVRKVANLARLELSDADLARAADQLPRSSSTSPVSELNTDGVNRWPTRYRWQNVFRADEPGTCLTPNEALANAPVRYGDYFASRPCSIRTNRSVIKPLTTEAQRHREERNEWNSVFSVSLCLCGEGLLRDSTCH